MQEMQEMLVQSLGREDPLDKWMSTGSSILAWKIPQRSLVHYSPLAGKASNSFEQTQHQ